MGNAASHLQMSIAKSGPRATSNGALAWEMKTQVCMKGPKRPRSMKEFGGDFAACTSPGAQFWTSNSFASIDFGRSVPLFGGKLDHSLGSLKEPCYRTHPGETSMCLHRLVKLGAAAASEANVSKRP